MEKSKSGNRGFIVDGAKLMGYIKAHAFFNGMKIKEYHKQIGVPYDSIFPIKRTNRIGMKTKAKLDKVYGTDAKYLKLFGPRIEKG